MRSLLLPVIGAIAGCATTADPGPVRLSWSPPNLELVAESPRYRWTGVAVLPSDETLRRPYGVQLGSDHTERIFVNFPHWNERAPMQVAEIMPDGSFRPYPDETWQDWSPGDDPAERFVCVQSVHIDLNGRLWVLDAGAPGFAGPVAGAPKLVQIDPATDEVVRVYRFDAETAPEGSYLNDVRINAGTAFISDSGRGGLVLVTLSTGGAKRILDESPLTTADATRDGAPFAFRGVIAGFTTPEGDPVAIHSDGIEIIPTNPMGSHNDADSLVVWQSITGTTLRAARHGDLSWLAHSNDPEVTPERIWIHELTGTPVTDGLAYDRYGSRLYFSALEENAVYAISSYTEFADYFTPDHSRKTRTSAPARSVTQRFTHPDLDWPDSFAVGDRHIYVTSAQIHTESPFGEPGPPAEPHRLFRFERR